MARNPDGGAEAVAVLGEGVDKVAPALNDVLDPHLSVDDPDVTILTINQLLRCKIKAHPIEALRCIFFSPDIEQIY